MTMDNREIEERFEQLTWHCDDTMCDARQAEFDYNGALPEYEDIADWKKLKRGVVKVG